VVKTPTIDLSDPQKSTSYDLRYPSAMLALDGELFGSDHNENLDVAAFFHGFSLGLQVLFEDTVVGHKSFDPGNSTLKLKISRGPTSAYETFDGSDAQYGMIPVYIIMLVSNLVGEQMVKILQDKEARFKETLSLAGQPVWTYFTSWFIIIFLNLLPYGVVLSFVGSFAMFASTSFAIIFPFFVLSTVGLATVAICLSTVFSTVTYGSMVGTMLLYAISVPAFLLSDPDIPLVVKDLVLMLPPCSITYGVT